MRWIGHAAAFGLILLVVTACNVAVAQEQSMKDVQKKLEQELVLQYGESQRPRIQRGMRQVVSLWREGDGDSGVFEQFVRENFAGDQSTLDSMFFRFERMLEALDGHMAEIGREFRQQAELDRGPVLPFDEVLAGYDASAHILDDFFTNKLAFVVLLNFPLSTLDERLVHGDQWTRRQWAEARLAQRFSRRIPAEANLAMAQATAEAEKYIAGYNIWMHHLVSDDGSRMFPPGLRLLSHWNLRDQLKAEYSEHQNGLSRQRMIQKVMERIVTQTIPRVVVDNPHVDWNPFTNQVKASPVNDSETPVPAGMKISADPEPDTRYATLLQTFLACRKVDPYVPIAPTLIARRFNEDRQIPEDRVRAMFEQVLASPLVPRIAGMIQERLGRPLEPFDIWYNGFVPRGRYTESMLDEIVSKKYPTAGAFSADIPTILVKLGFSKERAAYLADNIVVDPARGSGHALGAAMRSAKTHLRTRVGKGGMDYKGYNIAVHELGHNVEQVISLQEIDHTLLQGVPNTAFTEALAFVFQGRDLQLLGLAKLDAQSEALKTINDFWAAYEIAGVALVDMGIWHWMYDHPETNPAQLKEATLRIAREIWNTYYAPVFKQRDVVLLAIYSHIIHSFLYTPDYPLGHLIAHQIEEQIVKTGSVGPEVERMARVGNVAPDLWMRNATGSAVGAEALLAATKRALDQLHAQTK
jgi:hypothetical protein